MHFSWYVPNTYLRKVFRDINVNKVCKLFDKNLISYNTTVSNTVWGVSIEVPNPGLLKNYLNLQVVKIEIEKYLIQLFRHYITFVIRQW